MTSPPSSPLISFDAAGTLIQVREPVGETYAAFARQHGVTVDPVALKAAFRTTWGAMPVKLWPEGEKSPQDDREWWHELVRRVFSQALGHDLNPEILDPLFSDLYTHFAHPDAWTVYDDVLPALQDLSQDYALCVLSNFDRRLLGILQGHGLAPFFRHIILSSEVGASKPHPRMFATALRLMGASAATAVHVGDDLRCDIEGALACGWSAHAVHRPESGLLTLVKKVRSGEIPACAKSQVR